MEYPEISIASDHSRSFLPCGHRQRCRDKIKCWAASFLQQHKGRSRFLLQDEMLFKCLLTTS